MEESDFQTYTSQQANMKDFFPILWKCRESNVFIKDFHQRKTCLKPSLGDIILVMNKNKTKRFQKKHKTDSKCGWVQKKQNPDMLGKKISKNKCRFHEINTKINESTVNQ